MSILHSSALIHDVNPSQLGEAQLVVHLADLVKDSVVAKSIDSRCQSVTARRGPVNGASRRSSEGFSGCEKY